MTDSTTPLAFVCSPSYDDTGGVFSYRVDFDDHELERIGVTAVDGPKFMAIDRERNCLYTANQTGGGEIAAFEYDGSGTLTKLNSRPSGGENPCYVALDATREYLLVSNYTGGSVAMLSIGDDGALGDSRDVVEHEGSSIHPDRQTEPHPHSFGPGPENRFAFAPDLGTDRVEIYRLDLENGALERPETPYAEVHDGAGPRHFAFHPDGSRAYVINELDSTVTAFDYDPETGALSARETLSTLPDGFEGENYPADVHVHPSGQWLYGSNRGHDSIVIFEAGRADDGLAVQGFESTRGEWPRHFALGPGGRTLFAENQESDSIVPFDVEGEGSLSTWSTTETVPEPMCMVSVDPS